MTHRLRRIAAFVSLFALVAVSFALGNAQQSEAAVIESVDSAPTTTTTEPDGSLGVLSWCDPETWIGGEVPDGDDAAVINGPVVIGLPKDNGESCNPTVGAVTITADGVLEARGDDVELRLNATHPNPEVTGRVDVFGRLTMRPEAGQRHVLSYSGIAISEIVGGDDGMMTDAGGLHIRDGGVVDFDGELNRTSWTNLTNATSAGDLIFTVNDATDWQIGDELVVTPTIVGTSDTYSYARIVAVDGSTITVQGLEDHDGDAATPMVERVGLEHAHPVLSSSSGDIYAAEVINLTRDVVVRGDNSYVMTHPSATAPQHWADVAFEGLGVPDTLGRYPIHLHKQGEAARGSTFDRLLILDGENNAVVPHESHGTRWTDVAVHRTRGPGIWWDRAPSLPRGNSINSTNDTEIVRMIVSDTRKLVGSNDFRLTGYALNRGVGNSIVDSVAVGVGGRKDSSGFMWTEGEANGESGVWLFVGNLAHNNARHGVFTWQNTSSANHIIADLVAYGNGGWGVSHGAYRNKYQYIDLQLIANISGGVLIHSVSNGEPGQRFDNVRVEYSPAGIVTTRHQQSPQGPTYINNPSFVGVDRPLVAGGRNEPDDIFVTGWSTCPEWAADADPAGMWFLVDTGELCTP